MPITSNLDQKLRFEQRGTNNLERKEFYFNQPCSEVSTNSNKEKIEQKIEAMHQSLQGCGVGLAHNQFPKEEGVDNIPLAIFVIENISNPIIPFEEFINPVIVGFSSEKVSFPHGCLSAIGEDVAKMASYEKVIVAYYDKEFEFKIKKFGGFASVIVQHEYNHITTKGTYLEVVEKYLEDHKELDKKKFSPTREEIGEFKEILANPEYNSLPKVGDEIPCLTDNEILSRGKHYLSTHQNYQQKVNTYYAEHSEDQPLYDNLNRLPDVKVSLYGNVKLLSK